VALLVSLAAHDVELYAFFSTNDVAPTEIAKLGDAQTSSIERMENSMVAWVLL
jgi:hypothetical protein